MPRVTTSNLQLELVRQILALAIDGQWTLGARVSEQKLSRRFNVSRSPVRAALGLLEGRGLVIRDPNRGFILARLPGADDQGEAVAPSSEIDLLYTRLMADRSSNSLPKEVSEAELGQRYEVTRGILLKALMRLSSEGLAHRLRGHGWGFAESLDTPEALRDSYRFRLLVECGALREPGFHVDKAELAALRVTHLKMIESPPPSIARINGSG